MDTFDGDSALPASARRLLFGSGAPTPWSPLEGRDREVWGPVSPTAQPGVLDSNVLVIMAALVCALICAVGLFSMLRCALRCSRRMAFDSPQAVAVRRSNTGLKKAAINALPVVRYCEELRLPEAGTDCPICLAEFVEGERLRMLPQCNHCFHIECIDRWFRSHSSCPTCRHCLLGAKGKKATAADSPRPRQTCESSEAQSFRSADSIPVPDHVAPSSWPGDKSGESFKGDRSGMGCWNSGKASCDVECGIDR